MSEPELQRPATAEETPITFFGQCLSFNRLGKKCLFVDLLVVPETEFADDVEVQGRGPVIHLAGDHVPRPTALRLKMPVAGDVVWSVHLGGTSLPPQEFASLTAALGSPGELSKPLIGDIFRVTGTVTTGLGGDGVILGRMSACAAKIVSRGEVSRPGDFSEKWRRAAQLAKERRPPIEGGKRGVPRKNKNRFSVLADFILREMLPGERPKRHFIDVAGGGGQLAATLTSQGAEYTCSVIDPRPTTAALDRVTFVDEFLSAKAQEAILTDADVLIGLHCDGAVNELVRAACLYQRPFVIIPCCVFPKAYPRTLHAGDSVTTRDQLVEWICEQATASGFAGRVQMTRLPFEGANLAAVGFPAETGAAR